MDRFSSSGKAGATAAKLNKLKAQRQAGKALGDANSKPVISEIHLKKPINRQKGMNWEQALAGKDEVIQSLRSRLSIAQQQNNFQPEKQQEEALNHVNCCDGTVLEAENAQLEGANQQLRQRLQESLVELQHAHDQLHILQQLQHQLEEDVPSAALLVDTAVSQERALQASRNEKVLQLLKSKDEVISNYKARFAESQSECLRYKQQLDETLRDLDNKQLRVSELVESHAKLRENFESYEAAAAHNESAAKKEISELQGELSILRQRDAERCSLHDRIIAQQHDLATAHGEVQKLSEAVEAANVVIQELQAAVQEKERNLNDRDQEFALLQSHMSKIMNVPEAGISSLVAAAACSNADDPEERIAQLERANEILERALVGVNKEANAAQNSCKKENTLAHQERHIKSLKQQIDELEALHRLAQETTLQSENNLRENERQTSKYRQQCDILQQQLEQSEAVATTLSARVSELALAEQAYRSELQHAQQDLQQVQKEKSLCDENLEVLRSSHAHEVGRIHAQLADAETKLASSQEEFKALQEQLSFQQQAHQLHLRTSHKESRHNSSKDHHFSSHLDKDDVVCSKEWSSVCQPTELAALPQEELVNLVHSLQSDVAVLRKRVKGAEAVASSAQQRARAAENKSNADSQRQSMSLLNDISTALKKIYQNVDSAGMNEGDLQTAKLRLQRVNKMLHSAQREMETMKAEAASQYHQLLEEKDFLNESLEKAIKLQDKAERAHHAAELRAQERHAQLEVLSETLEVLQSKSSTAQEDQIMSMTAELATAKMKEVALNQRCDELEQHLQSLKTQVLASQQQLQLTSASGRLAQKAHVSDAAALRICREENERLHLRLMEHHESIIQLEAALSAANAVANNNKAAAAGLQEALQQAQERHMQQLTRERAEASAAVHSARVAGLQNLLQQAHSQDESRLSSTVKVSDNIPENDHQEVLQTKLAESEAKMRAAELQAAQAQCWLVEETLEIRTSEWQAALAEAEYLRQRIAELERAATHNRSHVLLEIDGQALQQFTELRIKLACMAAELQQVMSEQNQSKAEAAELIAKLALVEAPQTCAEGMQERDKLGAVNPADQPLVSMLKACQHREFNLIDQNTCLRKSIQELQNRLKDLNHSSQPTSLTQHVQQLEISSKEAVAEVNSLQAKLSEQQIKMQKYCSQVQNLQIELALKEAQLKDLKQQLETSQQQALERLSENGLQECEALAREALVIKGRAEEAAEQAQEKALQDILLAQQQVEELKQQLMLEQEEKVTLQSTLSQLESQLAEACAAFEAKAAALSLVQSHGQTTDSDVNANGKASSSIAVLSQRLLESNLLQVEANKQLQIAEKLNKSLEKQLVYAEHRAAQLKDAYVAKAKQVRLLLEQRATLADLSTEYLIAGLPDLFSDSSQTEIKCLSGNADELVFAPGESISRNSQLNPMPQNTRTLSALEADLAKKEADNERLQKALDKAFDVQRGQAESFATLAAHSQEKEQEQQKAINKLQQFASKATCQATSVAHGSSAVDTSAPLECSQRTVIRSLTLQLAELHRQLGQLSSERDQLQDRLRALRGSLGSGYAAEANACCGIQDLELLRVDPECKDDAAQTPAHAQQGSLDHINGMFILLRHHTKALVKAQESLAEVLQQQPPASNEPQQALPQYNVQKLENYERYLRGLKSQVTHATAMLAAELPAMQATMQVLSTEAAWLLRHRGDQQQASDTDSGQNRHFMQDDTLHAPLSLPPPLDTASNEVTTGDDNIIDNDIIGKLERARQRKDRWKSRYLDLEVEFTSARNVAEEREATLVERLEQIQRSHEELTHEHCELEAQLLSLRAAVAEATAEKAQLQDSLDSCTRELTQAASLADKLHTNLQAQQNQHSEVEGHLRQELQESQASLELQKSEHAQLVASVRGMIGSLQSSGNTESQLRSELLHLAEKVAVLTAAQEAARLEVENKDAALAGMQSELTSLQAEHTMLSAQKQLADSALSSMQEEYILLQQHLHAAEVNLTQVEDTLAARCAALESKVEEMQQAEPASAYCSLSTLDQLQAAAENLQDRFERVEAQAAVIIQQKQAATVAQWARLARSQRFKSAVHQLRDGLQYDLLEARARCYEQDAQLIQLHEAVSNSEQQCTQLLQQLDGLQAHHTAEVQDMVERHKQDLAAAEQDRIARTLEVQQQTDLMIKAAVVAAEQRTKSDMVARVAEFEERTSLESSNAKAQCQQLQSELADSRVEFKRYQALKAVEVKLVEQRVLHMMRTSGGALSYRSRQQAGKHNSPNALGGLLPQADDGQQLQQAGDITKVSDILAVCSSDGIAAALREAKLERMQREQVEEEAAAMHDAAEQLRTKLKAAEGELSALKARVGADTKSAREKAEKLQSELQECQEALRCARAESSRRLKDLQALQRQVSANDGREVPEEVLDQERQGREAAQAQLREARQSLGRKTAMVKELRSKVSELEQELVMNSSAPLQLELESCQARLKQLQASCASKESTIKELRHRLEEHVRLAAERGMQEERQRSREVIGDLRAEVERREAQIAGLQEKLQQVHEELAAATASMHSTVQDLEQRQSSLEGTGHKLVRSLQHGQQLSAVVQELLVLVEVLGTAVAASAAECCATQAQVAQRRGTATYPEDLAAQVSSLVDLPLEDVEALLGMGRESGDGSDHPALHAQDSASPSSLRGMLAQARDLTQELYAGFDSGDAGNGAVVASLVRLLAAVKQQCYRAKGALESAVTGLKQGHVCSDGNSLHADPDMGSRQSASAISHLEQQLMQAAREVAEIEERLL